jgi:hypothetical protein
MNPNIGCPFPENQLEVIHQYATRHQKEIVCEYSGSWTKRPKYRGTRRTRWSSGDQATRRMKQNRSAFVREAMRQCIVPA